MFKVRELDSGRLHEKHAVAPCQLRNISTFPLSQSKTKNTFVELGGFRTFQLHNISSKQSFKFLFKTDSFNFNAIF
jgi:hypothetical protein